MAALYIFLALLIQNSLTETIINDDDKSNEPRDILNVQPDVGDDNTTEYQAAPIDWMNTFIESGSTIFPTSSAALMAQATSSDKSAEEQLEDIKEIANQITMSIQSEMANLLSYAISSTSNETDNKLRRKRSVETPMDSSQLVMRLLKHIKSNNEYQNIAIEKMMTAQEIADKYGISFSPDPETLSDLALAANEQAEEMSAILKEAIENKNVTKREPEPNENTNIVENMQLNSTDNFNKCFDQYENKQENSTNHILNFEILKENDCNAHPAASHYNHYNYYPVESQIMSPPHFYNAPVSQRPNFYDLVSNNPIQDYYCTMEPTTTTIILSNDEPEEAEPELVAEEYEETVSSKVFINHEEAPDVSTVNHVMSYTISEKAHFRTPQIESLPQQMQYYFLLM
ncbi:jg5059 [Pararge aegeria aegeria]|uniref:Jg5059 protein n=1 Tax=Pararge aegeria aegeria TaxID=348720 RepID=A0A8S4R9B0_9NEOP|nr:jg5059 [Pararge aegeria aegeria]